ncbi:tyrosine-type recombinase/integrase [Nonomuraea sp. NPDC050328]|uniref:tyrosine-type recombinase/integrase n=1 Tax=Nonomuraea sp. NPDC050328 TaxID=3364361 RepID=UPI0037A27197
MLDSWELALKSANRSPGTIKSYQLTGRLFCDYLDQHDMPTTVDEVAAEHIRAFLAATLHGCWADDDQTDPCPCRTKATSPGNAHKHWRNIKAFFGWLVREGERKTGHPMENVAAPTVHDNPTPVFTDDDLRALLKACSGTSFADRRDTAILRILIDTGMRISGLAGLLQADVLLKDGLLRITLKGGDTLYAPIGAKTAQALDRYIRARARHPHAESDWLWLSPKGRFTSWGIRQMVYRRGREAGVAGVHPHRFRHTMADDWMEAGGSAQDLMRIAGWKSLAMVMKYGRSAADRRAHAAHAKLSPGNRI